LVAQEHAALAYPIGIVIVMSSRHKRRLYLLCCIAFVLYQSMTMTS